MSLETHDIQVQTWADGKVVEVSICGKLTQEDCETFTAIIDEGVEKFGQIRLLFDCVGFDGWTLDGLLGDTKFGLQHYRAIFRLAVVGDKAWEKAFATFCKPFTKADVQYFDIADIELARAWLKEGT
ncbi:STAS/SEC14 domain-containing protein [Pelagicoccus mobilis]|uniref:STAS/SEC14 domain-containing protein n=1 Tax=Pelagicoccus mobilis TaxID=415221 RepID=A0A934VU97_9BACT|nr:STAS/SEC14 domain-containing protein [Pelagicoccus mobilis]MBK1880523.1 STAS/SEC14 domain-containing protein [Pelagicoccus mobilis]